MQSRMAVIYDGNTAVRVPKGSTQTVGQTAAKPKLNHPASIHVQGGGIRAGKISTW